MPSAGPVPCSSTHLKLHSPSSPNSSLPPHIHILGQVSSPREVFPKYLINQNSLPSTLPLPDPLPCVFFLITCHYLEVQQLFSCLSFTLDIKFLRIMTWFDYDHISPALRTVSSTQQFLNMCWLRDWMDIFIMLNIILGFVLGLQASADVKKHFSMWSHLNGNIPVQSQNR